MCSKVQHKIHRAHVARLATKQYRPNAEIQNEKSKAIHPPTQFPCDYTNLIIVQRSNLTPRVLELNTDDHLNLF